jgi:vitamin B12 transporter
MKIVLNSITFLLCTLAAQAQTKISGTVKDNRNQPLRGASVTVKDTYDGASTDSLGRFSFNTAEKDSQVVEISNIGFKAFSKKVLLNGEPIVLNVSLKEQPNEETAVVVTAGSFEAGDKKRVTVLNSIDIVTTASANADITGALKTLPGTQQVGESEGLFVRGGTATESKIFIDGTQVNNFFYSSTPGIATRGRFNPFLFKGTVFSTGGYSALYGQALSSALVLESIDLPEQSSADIGISVLSLSGGFQKLDKKKKYSFGATASYTNLSLAFGIVNPKQDFYTKPNYGEGDLNFRIKTSKTGMLKYFGYFSANKVGFRNADIDSITLKNAFGLTNFNMYHNVSYKERLSRTWKLQAGVSVSTNKDDIVQELQDANNTKTTVASPSFYLFKNIGIKNKQLYLQSRIVLEKKLKGISALRFGAENSYSDEQTDATIFTGSVFTTRVKENITAIFAETDLYATNDLAVKIGGRTEYSQLLAKWNVAPRVAFAYKLSQKAQVSLAYGQFFQNPDRRILPTTNKVDFSKATHYILQYQKVTKDYTLRSELFYKKYNALYKTENNSIGQTQAANTLGNGYAQGFELFWRDRKTIKDLDYWISYSYLDTKRDFNNYPTSLRPSFASEHTASFIVKKFVTKWKTGFNASYNFATGRPYYNIVYNNSNNKNEVAEQGKTINYNNLSFSLNYLPYLGKTNSKKFMVLVMSVSNVLGQKQVFTYNFSNNGQRKTEVGPFSKRFLFIGCFISLGIDRTENAINNNL